MSDEKADEITTATAAIQALDSLDFKDKQEGIVNVLSEPNRPARYTNLRRSESIPLSKIQYAHEDGKVIEAWEAKYREWRERELHDWQGAIGGKDVLDELIKNEPPVYTAPPLPEDLVGHFVDYRVSEQHLLINVVKSVAHIVEGSGGGRGGFFGRRRG